MALIKKRTASSIASKYRLSELKVSDIQDGGTMAKDRNFYDDGGGLKTTVNDYYEFCKMLLNNGNFTP